MRFIATENWQCPASSAVVMAKIKNCCTQLARLRILRPEMDRVQDVPLIQNMIELYFEA